MHAPCHVTDKVQEEVMKGTTELRSKVNYKMSTKGNNIMKSKVNNTENIEVTTEVTPEVKVQEDKYVVIEVELEVELTMKERFADWAEYMATHAGIGKGIKCSLQKDRGEGPYSDATFHTQMNLVLKDKELLKKYPHLSNLKLTKRNKVTQLIRVK